MHVRITQVYVSSSSWEDRNLHCWYTLVKSMRGALAPTNGWRHSSRNKLLTSQLSLTLNLDVHVQLHKESQMVQIVLRLHHLKVLGHYPKGISKMHSTYLTRGFGSLGAGSLLSFTKLARQFVGYFINAGVERVLAVLSAEHVLLCVDGALSIHP